MQNYYGDDKVYITERKHGVTSSDAHKKLSVKEINMGVVLFTLLCDLSGGSVGNINLYALLQEYLLDIDKRKRINEIVKDRFVEAGPNSNINPPAFYRVTEGYNPKGTGKIATD